MAPAPVAMGVAHPSILNRNNVLLILLFFLISLGLAALTPMGRASRSRTVPLPAAVGLSGRLVLAGSHPYIHVGIYTRCKAACHLLQVTSSHSSTALWLLFCMPTSSGKQPL